MGSKRPDYILPGSYLLDIITAKAFVSRKKHDSVVVEFRVIAAEEMLNTDGTSQGKTNKVGGRVKAFFSLERDRDGELNEDGARWMSRLKTLLSVVLGGEDRVDDDGEPDPVTDDDVTPLIAASIIKGTELKVGTLTPEKALAAMITCCTAKSKDGGLGMTQEQVDGCLEDEESGLAFADVTGMTLRCEAKRNAKGNFTNLYWGVYDPEDEDVGETSE